MVGSFWVGQRPNSGFEPEYGLEDKKPENWVEDSKAKKPDDWDDEEDGEP